MGTIYRVTVTKETTDDKGGHEGDETLFELAGSATMIGRLAPAAVLDALITDEHEGAYGVAPPVPQQQVLADRVWDAAVANGTVPAAPAEAEAAQSEKPRRTRRTKQQIAEDKAKEEQQAAMQAHVNSVGQGGPGGEVAAVPPAAEAWPAAPSMPGAPAGPQGEPVYNPFG